LREEAEKRRNKGGLKYKTIPNVLMSKHKKK